MLIATAFLTKLLSLFVGIGVGFAAGRHPRFRGEDTLQAISSLAFYLMAPALLFRATANMDTSHLPASFIAAYFLPAGACLLLLYGLARWQAGPPRTESDAPLPTIRALAAIFGNTLQLGMPLIASLYGDTGLGLLLTLISLHALILVGGATVLVEWDLARVPRSGQAGHAVWGLLGTLLRQTLVHPVITPVLLGFVWHALLGPLPGPLDDILKLLGSGTVPVCLLLIGLSLSHYGVKGYVKPAVTLTLLKTLALPLVVWAFAYGALGLTGLTLDVLVMTAALPVGSNPLILAHRYRCGEGEVTAATVVSTLALLVTLPVWFWVLQHST